MGINFAHNDKMSINIIWQAVLCGPFKIGVNQLTISRTPLLGRAQLSLVGNALSREEVHVVLKKCAHHLFSSFSHFGMCWPCFRLLSLNEVSAGVFRARQENALKADEREVCAGSSSISQREISVSEGNLLYCFWAGSEWEGKYLLPFKWKGPSCQTLVGMSCPITPLSLPSHE